VKVDWNYTEDMDMYDMLTREIIFSRQKINSCDKCGIIDQNFIAISGVSGFMHNKQYNSCLNLKVSIDIHGSIKNCPSLDMSFGNISETSLMEVVKNPKFKEMWQIKKDNIDICKDCELRYACSDCRAYRVAESMVSKPLKCSYKNKLI